MEASSNNPEVNQVPPAEIAPAEPGVEGQEAYLVTPEKIALLPEMEKRVVELYPDIDALGAKNVLDRSAANPSFNEVLALRAQLKEREESARQNTKEAEAHASSFRTSNDEVQKLEALQAKLLVQTTIDPDARKFSEAEFALNEKLLELTDPNRKEANQAFVGVGGSQDIMRAAAYWDRRKADPSFDRAADLYRRLAQTKAAAADQKALRDRQPVLQDRATNALRGAEAERAVLAAKFVDAVEALGSVDAGVKPVLGLDLQFAGDDRIWKVAGVNPEKNTVVVAMESIDGVSGAVKEVPMRAFESARAVDTKLFDVKSLRFIATPGTDVKIPGDSRSWKVSEVLPTNEILLTYSDPRRPEVTGMERFTAVQLRRLGIRSSAS